MTSKMINNDRNGHITSNFYRSDDAAMIFRKSYGLQSGQNRQIFIYSKKILLFVEKWFNMTTVLILVRFIISDLNVEVCSSY